MAKTAKKLAKKYISRPEDWPEHKYFDLEKMAQSMNSQGIDIPTIHATMQQYIEDERDKCMASPIYFANAFGFIIGHGSAGVMPMTCAPYQETLLTTVRSNKYSICVKSRQLGVSTIMVFYALWFSIFSTGKRTLIVAHNREAAQEFITKVKTAYEFLPEWMKPACVLYSKDTIEFDTKSKIKAITSNPHAARSFSATLFVLDEAGFIDGAHEVVKGLLPTIAAGDGKLIALSSPNGNSDENWFYNTCVQAKNKTNGWAYHEFPWTVSPVFCKNPTFREDQIRIDNGNVDKFTQEYECNFDVNLASLFNKEALKAFIPSDKILNKEFGGVTYDDTFHIWNIAEEGKNYIIGVDCSANKSSSRDYSAFQVLDRDTQEQVAEYMGRLDTEILADILIKAANHYNKAEIVFEENSYSEMLVYLVENRGYTNFWYADDKSRPGFNTNRHNRVLLIEKLVLFYNNKIGMSRLKSRRLKVQMENFSQKTLLQDGTRKIEAVKGNDDLALALALALIPLTPKYQLHRAGSEIGIAVDGKDFTNGDDYPDEYLEYYSELMGISVSSLAHRLKLYHDIKQGKYDGSGVEEVELKHPVEEFEKARNVADFLGTEPGKIISDTEISMITISRAVVPTRDSYVIDDIFEESFQQVQRAHRNFISGVSRSTGQWMF